jgi:hypothetical protein
MKTLENVFEYNDDGSFKKVTFWINKDTYVFFKAGNKKQKIADAFGIMTKQEGYYKISGTKMGLLENLGNPKKQYEAFINEVKRLTENQEYYEKV